MTVLARRQKTAAVKAAKKRWGPDRLWSTGYAGIDYGGRLSNLDDAGFRYGVISVNALNEWAWESFEAEYSKGCPECGGGVTDDTPDDAPDQRGEYWCPPCKKFWESDDVYGDEPDGYALDDGEYTASVDSHNDVFLVKSPYYTHAQFCSPCAPGAGHLENPCKNGPRTYCFGHDWFTGGRAPYAVFSVGTGRLVPPPRE